MPEEIIKITGLKNYLGGEWVHKDINLSVYKGEVLAIIGGSGSGKTTILRSILMLMQPTAGEIEVFGTSLANIDETSAHNIRRRWGMLFQQSALFSSLNVLENIMFPMKELTNMSSELMRELAEIKISMVGLPPEVAYKYPAELSGGMKRRAAAARAIAMDPELLFLDEPTSGLDPVSARKFDELVSFLQHSLKLTIVIVSHDVESLKRTTDRVAFVGDGRILAAEPINKLMRNKNALIADYFKNI